MKKKPKFNWLTFLTKAIKREPSSQACTGAIKRARDWPSCAVGGLCRQIPRYNDGCPQDLDLYNFGLEFTYVVEARNWTRALSVFKQIEARADKLLKRVAKQSTTK